MTIVLRYKISTTRLLPIDSIFKTIIICYKLQIMRLFPVATVLTQDQLFHLCTMDQIHVSHQEVHIVRVHVIGEVIARSPSGRMDTC
jgi:hypothetical protein